MIKNLNEKDFSKYGKYIRRPQIVSNDKGDYHCYWHDLIKSELSNESITTGFLTIYKQPYIVNEVERHQRFGEIFITVSGKGILTVAESDACVDGEIDKSKVEYFLLNPGDAVLLTKGVWHKPPVPIDDAVDFLMVLPEDILSDIDIMKLNNPLIIPLAIK
jgi:ureidoglycolate hydrolase